MRRTVALFALLFSALFLSSCANLNLHFGKKASDSPKVAAAPTVAIAPPEAGFPGEHWKLAKDTWCVVNKVVIGRKTYVARTPEEGIFLAVDQITKNGRMIRQSKALIHSGGVIAAEAEVIHEGKIVTFSTENPGDAMAMKRTTLAALGITEADFNSCDMQPVPRPETK